MDTKAEKRGENFYAISMALTVKGNKKDDKDTPVFNMVVEMTGFYEISGYDEEKLKEVMYVYAANDLYTNIKPFVSMMYHYMHITPVVLPPMDFHTNLKLQQEVAEKEAAKSTPAANEDQ